MKRVTIGFIALCLTVTLFAEPYNIKDPVGIWKNGDKKLGKDIANSAEEIVKQYGNVKYEKMNKASKRIVIGMDSKAFLLDRNKQPSKIEFTKDVSDIDLGVTLGTGAQFINKNYAFATSGKNSLYLMWFKLEIELDKPVQAFGIFITNIKDQDWEVIFYGEKGELASFKVKNAQDNNKPEKVFVGYKAKYPIGITKIFLKRNNKKSKKPAFVDDIIIIP